MNEKDKWHLPGLQTLFPRLFSGFGYACGMGNFKAKGFSL